MTDRGRSDASQASALTQALQAVLDGTGSLKDFDKKLATGRFGILKGAQTAPNRSSSSSSLPLSLVLSASQAGNIGACRVLLKHGASANMADEDGISPLHSAAFRGNTELAELLVQYNADANARDSAAQPPLFFAPTRSICECLCRAKADVNAKNDSMQTALHLAAYAGMIETLEWLSANIDPTLINAVDKTGCTAADYAIQSKSKSTARLLRMRGGKRSRKTPEEHFGNAVQFVRQFAGIKAPGRGAPRFIRRRRAPHPLDVKRPPVEMWKQEYARRRQALAGPEKATPKIVAQIKFSDDTVIGAIDEAPSENAHCTEVVSISPKQNALEPASPIMESKMASAWEAESEQPVRSQEELRDTYLDVDITKSNDRVIGEGMNEEVPQPVSSSPVEPFQLESVLDEAPIELHRKTIHYEHRTTWKEDLQRWWMLLMESFGVADKEDFKFRLPSSKIEIRTYDKIGDDLQLDDVSNASEERFPVTFEIRLPSNLQAKEEQSQAAFRDEEHQRQDVLREEQRLAWELQQSQQQERQRMEQQRQDALREEQRLAWELQQSQQQERNRMEQQRQDDARREEQRLASEQQQSQQQERHRMEQQRQDARREEQRLAWEQQQSQQQALLEKQRLDQLAAQERARAELAEQKALLEKQRLEHLAAKKRDAEELAKQKALLEQQRLEHLAAQKRDAKELAKQKALLEKQRLEQHAAQQFLAEQKATEIDIEEEILHDESNRLCPKDVLQEAEATDTSLDDGEMTHGRPLAWLPGEERVPSESVVVATTPVDALEDTAFDNSPKLGKNSFEQDVWRVDLDSCGQGDLGVTFLNYRSLCHHLTGSDIRLDILLVSDISPFGRLATWNARHAEMAVREGDRVVEVNGKQGYGEILTELEGPSIWMHVTRPPQRIILKCNRKSAPIGLKYQKPAHNEVGHLRITSVFAGSTLSYHNEKSVASGAWDRLILPQMTICSVNGIRGDAASMVKALARHEEVEVQILRLLGAYSETKIGPAMPLCQSTASLQQVWKVCLLIPDGSSAVEEHFGLDTINFGEACRMETCTELDADVLLVSRLHSSKLAARFNENYPSLEIREGDRILSVNGCITAEQMARALQLREHQEHFMTLCLTRPITPFLVRLTKSGRPLGLSFKIPTSSVVDYLLIVDVLSDGLMAEHNATHLASGCWDLVVLPYMSITCVNGIEGDVEQMMNAMLTEEAIELQIRRTPLASPFSHLPTLGCCEANQQIQPEDVLADEVRTEPSENDAVWDVMLPASTNPDQPLTPGVEALVLRERCDENQHNNINAVILLVRYIDPTGLLAAWNTRNPGVEVREGDRIVSINGKSSIDEMKQLLLGSHLDPEHALTMRILRPLDPFRVSLLRRGRSLGLSFKKPMTDSLDFLLIVDVLPDGLVSEYNSAQLACGRWDRVVMPNMGICGVNGVEGDASKLMNAISVYEDLDLQIRRKNFAARSSIVFDSQDQIEDSNADYWDVTLSLPDSVQHPPWDFDVLDFRERCLTTLGHDIGLEVALIGDVDASIPLAAWNEAHPSSRVCEGDHILSINGISTFVGMKELLLAGPRELNLRLKRPDNPFNVSCVKGGRNLGLNFKKHANTSVDYLLIVDVLADSLIAEHNSKQLANCRWDRVVLPYMSICNVNGFEGDVTQMMEAIARCEQIDLQIRRTDLGSAGSPLSSPRFQRASSSAQGSLESSQRRELPFDPYTWEVLLEEGQASSGSSASCGFQVLDFAEECREKLGIKIEAGVLLISSILPSGALGEWNKQHRGKEVLQGDRLVEVSGARQADEMLAILRRPLCFPLRLQVERIKREIVARVTRESGQPLGFRYKKLRDTSKQQMLITEVLSHGAAAQYNAAQVSAGSWELLIIPGMIIKAVNGFEGIWDSMLEALMHSDGVELQLQRTVQSPSAPAYRPEEAPKAPSPLDPSPPPAELPPPLLEDRPAPVIERGDRVSAITA